MTRRMKMIIAAALALAAVAGAALLLGWLDGPSVAPKSASPTQKQTTKLPSTDACELFTAADASRVLNQPMRAAGHNSNAGKPGVIIPATSCAYRSNDAKARLSLITITVNYADTAAKIAVSKANFDSSRNSSDIAVPDLGDDAYFVPSPALYKLHVLKNAYHFIIDVGDDKQPLPDQAATEAVARAMLAKL